MLKKYIVA